MSSNLGLTDYQFYMGPPGGTGGLTFGLGTNVDVMKITGLTDLEVRRDDRPLARRHGAVPGLHSATDRSIELEIVGRKGSLTGSQWRQLIDDIDAAFGVVEDTQKELHWKFPDESERFMRARGIRRATVRDWRTETGLYAIRSQVHAPDPRYYTATKATDNANTGTFNVVNNGKANAFPLVTFHRSSAVTRVRITNNTTGQVFDIDGLPSATTDVFGNMDILARGEPGLVIYVGSTNRYSNWARPRTPFYLAPGTNSITLNNGSSVDFEWWHTFL